MRLWPTNPFHPLTIVRGERCTVWDDTGKAYVDLLSGTWCNALGYAHPRWVEAVRDQVGRLTHAGPPFHFTEVEDALAKLAEILPAFEDAIFLSSGSEAVELALKVARAATGGDAIVVVERGYYGATTYALALSEAGRAAPYLPRLGAVERVPVPHCARCPAGTSWPCAGFPCLDGLERLVADGPRVAAVLYEPVMGAGIFAPPIGWGARLRELASRLGALLVAEEVTTGLGRTGRWFGFEHDGIVPDVVVIGKAIGGGLPISAVVTTAEVETRARDVLGRHVQSHQNDPLSGRVAATVISIFQEERLVEHAAERGGQLRDGLETLAAKLPCIREVRGRGAMLGVELRPPWSSRGAEVARTMLESGFILDYHAASSTFRLLPPFVITTAEIDRFLSAFGRALEACTASMPPPVEA